MVASDPDVPVHDSLHVTTATDIYRTDEWWKAVVTYGFEDSEADETAMYLWHEDDGWNRKNKYVVKTPEAWEIDRTLIDKFLRSDPPPDTTTEFPASDYYTVATGETVFQNDGWWKGILNVVEKGSYETNEVMVYVWQQVDDDWRRRQKYTIKSIDEWRDEREVIKDHLSIERDDDVEIDTYEGDSDDEVWQALTKLGDEVDSHLSGEFTD
ncbi:hypothetical protein BRC64_05725 [Halobacteriales archaeon QH_10_67_22]|nr:MAG: hypothetical protein BRC64_05725 [Halobacteriales archaeon QH_10_67_22]